MKDLLVIGFGKGGKMAAKAAAHAGKSVVLVEQSPRMYGGTCINVGCVPTKILVRDAQAFAARKGQGSWEEANAAFLASIGRKDTLTGAMNQKNFAMIASEPTAEVVTGTAHFIDPHTVEVQIAEGVELGAQAGAQVVQISAKEIIINTGATPFFPPVEGLHRSARILSTEEVMNLSSLPRRIAIIGAGPIGLEFAEIFAAYGTEVTVLEGADRILGRESESLAARVARTLTNHGIQLRTGVAVMRVNDSEEAVTITLGDGTELDVDVVLVAAGRRPNTERLNAQAAGVELGARGEVVVDEHMRTSQPHIFALGDVNGGLQFTYISLDDMRIYRDAVNPPTGRPARSLKDRVAVPTSTFINPPLSTVGMDEDQAREAGYSVKVFHKDASELSATPRVRINGAAEGEVTVIVNEENGKILGARIYMTGSEELINLVALAMRAHLPYTMLRDGIWTHPSTTEVLNEVLS